MEEKNTNVAEQQEQPQSQGLAIRNESFAPKTFQDAVKFSQMVSDSDLAPQDFRGKPANVLIAIQMGFELGLSPMAAIQNIAVINGRPSIWGDAMLAIVQANPRYLWHKEWIDGEGDNMTAHCQVMRRGFQDPIESKFSVADAKTAKLWGNEKKDPWLKFPKRMLQMRARGFALRDAFADALRGLFLAEEARDLPADRHRKGTATIVKAEVIEQQKKLEAAKSEEKANGKSELISTTQGPDIEAVIKITTKKTGADKKQFMLIDTEDQGRFYCNDSGMFDFFRSMEGKRVRISFESKTVNKTEFRIIYQANEVKDDTGKAQQENGLFAAAQ